MLRNKPKVLLYDIETSPLLCYTWVRHDASVLKVLRESELMSIAWKWQGERAVHGDRRPDFSVGSEKPLVRKLRDLLSEADVVIGHNVRNFDNKKSNTFSIFHGENPPAPYQVIDTLEIARRHFAFSSNRLNDLGTYLKVGQKLSTGGFDLWDACMNASRPRAQQAAFHKLLRYNKQDVHLLEAVYEKLKPWDQRHAALNVIGDKPTACPRGCKAGWRSHGLRFQGGSAKRRMQCNGCGGWAYIVAVKAERKAAA